LEFGVLGFEEGGKQENPEEKPLEQGTNQQQTQPTYMAPGWNRTWATFILVGGKHCHHCTIPAPQYTHSQSY